VWRAAAVLMGDTGIVRALLQPGTLCACVDADMLLAAMCGGMKTI
jgi:hypothetical protein